MSTRLLVRCNTCGNEWNANPQHLIRGHCCKKCALERRDCSNNTRKTTAEFISEMSNINPMIRVLGEYISAHTPIMCECLVCHNIWQPRPANIISGTGCPRCGYKSNAQKQRKSTAQFKVELSKINPEVEVIGCYESNKTNIECRCLRCLKTWYSLPSNLLRGEGCPYHNASKGEKFITSWLNKHQIAFIPQKRFDDLRGVQGRRLPYDFYLQDYNTLIEFQGNYHDKTDRRQSYEDFAIRQKHDKRKAEYAVSHNFNFVEIWYYDNIEEKLNEILIQQNP